MASMTPKTFLVLGATGGTGKHFVSLALADGHRVRALARTPSKMPSHDNNKNLDVRQGSVTDPSLELDDLVAGVDYVVAMIGDKEAQRTAKINTAFVKRLVPAMRRQGVKRFLYQSGGLTRPYGGSLSPITWIFRYTIARGFDGQHSDNEAVHGYLATEAMDLEWMIHRAGIIGDGPSKGTLVRSDSKISIGVFRDTAAYNYRTIVEDAAVHTCDMSYYASQ
ncbi:hypothetical protein LTR17_002760 [Elasticomyces elasticus]|nr:hypothetical protein LTR17_002760 [Elasticomyces elasticus]